MDVSERTQQTIIAVLIPFFRFQEQLLSRRALFFIDNEIHFRCQQFTWSENTLDQIGTPNSDAINYSLLTSASKMQVPVDDYATLLLYYTERIFSHQHDVIRALSGLIRRFSWKMKSSFFQGMPTASFDIFMPFLAHDSLLHRRHGFPSYSWAGWIGKLQFIVNSSNHNLLNSWLQLRTWIVWFKRRPSGTTDLVWDIMANEDFLKAGDEDVGYRDRSRFGSRHPLGFSTDRILPTEEIDFSKPLPDYPLLQFWTLSVHFTIGNFEVFAGEAYVIDKNQVRCGHLKMDGFESDTFFKSGSRYEFILLSESVSDQEYRSYMSRHFMLDIVKYDSPYQTYSWKYYHVLVLEWDGGVAERRGGGVISRSAIENSLPPGPVWKEILLA
jgi:hypothetical protein